MRHPWRITHCLVALIASAAGCSALTTWDGLTDAAGRDADLRDGASTDPTDGGSQDSAADGADAPARGCTSGEVRCGGHRLAGDPGILYRCDDDGGSTQLSVCMYGCIVSASASDKCGVCAAGSPYCGGDKIPGDPRTLYRCNGDGTTTVIEICPTSCVVRPGQNDICN